MWFAIFYLAAFILGAAVTVFAFMTAKDGYEDRFGFHEASVGQSGSDGRHETSDSRDPIPPLATAG